MRLLICLAVLAVPWLSRAWDTLPHQQITKAALDRMPKSVLNRFGTEVGLLVEIYCMYPDRYAEMENFGFVRNSAGPRRASEIARYCVRPDGRNVHGATGDQDSDTASLVYLFERILSNLEENRSSEAAKYAGVLSHFIADSLSPPHAVDPAELLELSGGVNVHSAIERSLPEFTLADRPPRIVGDHIVAAAEAILQQCYAGARQNREDLPGIVKAACAKDQRTLDVYRHRAGRRAAGILADALFTIAGMADSGL